MTNPTTLAVFATIFFASGCTKNDTKISTAHLETAVMQPIVPVTIQTTAPEKSTTRFERIFSNTRELRAFSYLRVSDQDHDGELIQDGDWEIISGITLDGKLGASCKRQRGKINCFDFSGYGINHLGDVFAKNVYKEVAPPAWAIAALTIPRTELIDDAVDDLTWVEADVSASEPYLTLRDNSLGVRFAARVGGNWKTTSLRDGGKTAEPAVWQFVDTSVLTPAKSFGVVLSSYVKEGCVRAEFITMEIFQLQGDEFIDIGHVEMGEGIWLSTEGNSHFGLYDQRDPNHYRVRLSATTQQAKLILAVADKHLPNAGKLRRIRDNCRVEVDFQRTKSILTRAGAHLLKDVLCAPATNNQPTAPTSKYCAALVR
jgi:hypothetical protein